MHFKQLEYFYIELINKGFSKQYLYKRILSIFVYSTYDTNFDIQYNKFEQVIRSDNKNYTIIVRHVSGRNDMAQDSELGDPA